MARVYIAGPMTGLPEFNYPAFNDAADKLRDAGHHVENPADIGVVDGWTWQDYVRAALAKLITCDEVATLPDWDRSPGATTEVRLAESLALPVRKVADLLP